ncbi:uncharacterized protein VDAG_04343 [Verticillium dahliae VdLs.17]|uniref:Helicase C-terminal domain-containing protein n=1 Tax=Verticillium dahliae (strain VdLs.17 / ATCC MYA-4575 / FGSC 10137) TaxID=498257 RepID=G2X219_VERDV|nr:uncharacterized protein VDAG_04343 [Verticillium dahliae VdLs.17]EGY22905.1 hypothetical protein VDAG_04343 [Verticillium dahliae VdLs.17]
MASRFHGYIPVGCLIGDDIVNPSRNTAPTVLHNWNIPGEDTSVKSRTPEGCAVPPNIRARFSLRDGLSRLYESNWIRLEHIALSGSAEVLRVYILPDDVDNNNVPRSDVKLQKDRRALFTMLDFSPEAWSGRPGTTPRSSPEPAESTTEEELSLLEMFNNIPSPDPDPDTIVDPSRRESVDQLLVSKVRGLKTSLYPYQRRSAALMAMREAQPGKSLDPRLLRVKDQAGEDWYYDAAACVILREPRYYDGVQGGILAEQMGAGKTLICLALILATKSLPTQVPAHCLRDRTETGRIRSLADMAAAKLTAEGFPWRYYFGAESGLEHSACVEVLSRNPGFYRLPLSNTSRRGRTSTEPADARKITISHSSLIVVPNNLLKQWQGEVKLHTTDSLSVLVLHDKDPVPAVSELALYDVIFLTHFLLERMVRAGTWEENPLGGILFKRCIVDEGHKLGNSTHNARSDFLLGLDNIHTSSRWVVSGTPSKGLYGVDEKDPDDQEATKLEAEQLRVTEKGDLARIGAIATLYLKARPWANSGLHGSKSPWSVYVMQPRHLASGAGRSTALRATLNSLIIRHRLSELTHVLPDVDEKTVFLDGSYQDKLSLNIFSMVIVANAVLSQRTDADYFFHQRNRKFLLQLVHNLKQACFFGGSFFSHDEIATPLETAVTFLHDSKVPISSEDEAQLRRAMDVAKLALENPLKSLSNAFHEMPVYVRNFLPGGAGAGWSIDHAADDPVCTNAPLIMAAQKLIRPALSDETALNSLLNGGFLAAGRRHRDQVESEAKEDSIPRGSAAAAAAARNKTLAGKTKLGDDQSLKKLRTNAAFAKAELVATASAKMTYLLDAIIEHHEHEKIIAFYENENTAWYIASMLDVIQIEYLIYAKTLTQKRKSQYINTFNNDTKFRVILMDITQAAYGLDMRAASRIYFLNPVLNPQVEAQAIGRARRISQQKAVSVETLVLRGSIEEVIIKRKHKMSQAEHTKCKSILDDRPLFNYIRNPGFLPMPEGQHEGLAQTASLRHPQPIFGRGFGRVVHPDEDLWITDGAIPRATVLDETPARNGATGTANGLANRAKRPHGAVMSPREPGEPEGEQAEESEPVSRRIRFA